MQFIVAKIKNASTRYGANRLKKTGWRGWKEERLENMKVLIT